MKKEVFKNYMKIEEKLSLSYYLDRVSESKFDSPFKLIVNINKLPDFEEERIERNLEFIEFFIKNTFKEYRNFIQIITHENKIDIILEANEGYNSYNEWISKFIYTLDIRLFYFNMALMNLGSHLRGIKEIVKFKNQNHWLKDTSIIKNKILNHDLIKIYGEELKSFYYVNGTLFIKYDDKILKSTQTPTEDEIMNLIKDIANWKNESIDEINPIFYFTDEDKSIFITVNLINGIFLNIDIN